MFYTYLVRNGAWRARRDQRSRASLLEGADEARARLLTGTFPPFVVQQCVAMLDYYGQSPIIVRSSSLLEDGFGNAFTGKYESVFCPNQGAPEERLEALLAAVRTVYASAMSEAALRYRDDRGLLERDEQMAILVQRVSGAVHGRFFYPQAAGVALSYNPYVWNHAIDPDAGVVRLVFGMGTRAVDRSDDDYTRIVALNAPQLRPETSLDEATEYAQRRVDVLDLEANRFTSAPIDEVVAESPDLPIELFATRRRGPGGGWVLTFEKLLWATPLVEEMRSLLAALRDAYRYPVDVEFTANFLAGGDFRLNLVQCRPLQVKEGGIVPPPPDGTPGRRASSPRAAARSSGQSTNARVDRVIFVDPDTYATLSTQDRYEVARVIGRVTRSDDARAARPAARPRPLGHDHAFARASRSRSRRSAGSRRSARSCGSATSSRTCRSARTSSTISWSRGCCTSHCIPPTPATGSTRHGSARRRTCSRSSCPTTPGSRTWCASSTSRCRATTARCGCTPTACARR